MSAPLSFAGPRMIITAPRRALGVLAAALLLALGFSGVGALPGDGSVVQAPAALAEPTRPAAPATGPADSGADTADAADDAAKPLHFRTGHTMTPADLAAFKARVALLQEQGLHRGHAVYVHAA